METLGGPALFEGVEGFALLNGLEEAATLATDSTLAVAAIGSLATRPKKPAPGWTLRSLLGPLAGFLLPLELGFVHPFELGGGEDGVLDGGEDLLRIGGLELGAGLQVFEDR